MKKIGLIAPTRTDEHQQNLIDETKQQLSDRGVSFRDQAPLRPKCNTEAVMLMDGCLACLNYGDSKCR